MKGRGEDFYYFFAALLSSVLELRRENMACFQSE